MADKIAIKDVGQGILVKYKDQGDGTHAEVFSTSSATSTANISTGSTQTANPGTAWTALTAGECSQITLSNTSGTTISYRYGTTATVFDLPTNTAVVLPCLANSNEWQIQRKDTSNTQVAVQFLRVG